MKFKRQRAMPRDIDVFSVFCFFFFSQPQQHSKNYFVSDNSDCIDLSWLLKEILALLLTLPVCSLTYTVKGSLMQSNPAFLDFTRIAI